MRLFEGPATASQVVFSSMISVLPYFTIYRVLIQHLLVDRTFGS